MRVPSSRLVRLGGVTRGSIAETGDTELQVPGVLQMSIELSSPLDKVQANITAQQNDSHFSAQNLKQTGIAVGQTADLSTFERGLWSMDITFTGMFLGTTNVALVSDSLVLIDPDSSVQPLFGLVRVNGAQANFSGTFRFAFQRDGFKLQLQSSATVGGDSLVLVASLNARKSL